MKEIEIKLTIPWTNDPDQRKHVYEIYLNSIIDAINLSVDNYEELENYRKDLLLLVYQVESMQGKLRFKK